MQPFLLKYQPKTLADIKGQDKPLQTLQNYIQNYRQQKKKAVLIYGPIGCGKTSSVYALARQQKAEIIEINSSDLRNEEALNSTIGQALKQRSLFAKSKIILIDEIDNIFSRQDRGCVQTLNQLIQSSTYPLIITANDPFNRKLSSLRRSCQLIEFNPLSSKIIAQHLASLCRQENIRFEPKALNTLAQLSAGDLRGALIDLQLLTQDKTLTSAKLEHLDERKKTDTIFNALRLIFKATDIKNSLSALDNLDLPLNELFLWLDENLPKEYTQPEDLYQAYQKLSKADLFNRRIQRQQHWRFLVYIYSLLTAGLSSSKTKKNPSFIKYTPTLRILKLWQAKLKNARKKDLAEKLALKTHSSQKQTLRNFPYFQHIFRHSPEQASFIRQLDLSNDEVAWLNRIK